MHPKTLNTENPTHSQQVREKHTNWSSNTTWAGLKTYIQKYNIIQMQKYNIIQTEHVYMYTHTHTCTHTVFCLPPISFTPSHRLILHFSFTHVYCYYFWIVTLCVEQFRKSSNSSLSHPFPPLSFFCKDVSM